MTSQFPDMTLSLISFKISIFLLASLSVGTNFTSISWLLLELWQISFIKDWPEIVKPEIPLSEFCEISGEWRVLGIPYLAQMSLIKLLNAAKCQSYSFYRFWIIKGKTAVGVKLFSLPRLGLIKEKRKETVFSTYIRKFPSLEISRIFCYGNVCKHILHINFADFLLIL